MADHIGCGQRAHRGQRQVRHVQACHGHSEPPVSFHHNVLCGIMRTAHSQRMATAAGLTARARAPGAKICWGPTLYPQGTNSIITNTSSVLLRLMFMQCGGLAGCWATQRAQLRARLTHAALLLSSDKAG